MKYALVCPGRVHSPNGSIRMEVIRQLAAVKDVTCAVTAMISRLEHGEEVDASAVLRRSAAARDDANRFIDAMILKLGSAMKKKVAEAAACLGKKDSGAEDQVRSAVGSASRPFPF
jgi:hypothetical protein